MENLSNEAIIALYHAETDALKKEEIRENFFRKNVNYAHFIASRFKNSNLSHDDLTSLASIGMVKAFNSFKVDAGVKFATYAANVMNNEILMQFRKEKRHLGTISIDSTLNGADGSEMPFLDILTDDSCFELDVEQAELMREIREVAPQILNEKELFVLFGGLGDSPLTQKQIGEKLGFSQSYTGRLIKKAIKKLSDYFSETAEAIEQKKRGVGPDGRCSNSERRKYCGVDTW